VCFRFVAVCHLLKTGVAAIFGPQSPQTASHVQSICDTMEIPHLETRWDFRLRRESCLVNLYPHPRAISKVGRNNTEIINARADYFPRRPQKMREFTRLIRFAAGAFIFFMSDGASNSTSSLLLVIYLFVFLWRFVCFRVVG
jgi:Receptor family ligand binding region